LLLSKLSLRLFGAYFWFILLSIYKLKLWQLLRQFVYILICFLGIIEEYYSKSEMSASIIMIDCWYISGRMFDFQFFKDHEIGTWLNFFSWFKPQCQSSNILKKSTIFIAICSTFSLVNCAWYVERIDYIMMLLLPFFIYRFLSICDLKVALFSNSFANEQSSSSISKIAFLASVQN